MRKRISVYFDTVTDADIISWLENQSNYSASIRLLIKDSVMRSGFNDEIQTRLNNYIPPMPQQMQQPVQQQMQQQMPQQMPQQMQQQVQQPVQQQMQQPVQQPVEEPVEESSSFDSFDNIVIPEGLSATIGDFDDDEPKAKTDDSEEKASVMTGNARNLVQERLRQKRNQRHK